ncbi:T9SS type A sorting domain-containing protein [Empedobacter tilapiae]|uniref:T9SS type A sorting domain-containing protein n=1 Tax=Empedobacter tilapiae TaxID=2491114 RepID=UPI001FE300D1|nr:T9SS type A sorting domain-containing protein [Empedobacter tilapiae]
MRKTLLSVFSLFSMLTISAQQDVLWEKTFGGEQAEYLYHAIPTLDYGFLILGSSASDATGDIQKKNQGGLDYFIWKMDENGNQEWQNSFGGDGDDLLKSAITTPEGGFLLVGSSNSSKSGDKTEKAIGMMDVWMIKLDPTGTIQWQKTIGGLGNDEALTVIRTTDKGYLIGVNSDSPKSNIKSQDNFGSNDFWIIKLDEKGTVLWEKTIGGEQEEALKTIVETKNGYLIGGISNSKKGELKSQDSHYLSSVWLVELNKEGEIIQEKTLENDQQSNLVSLNSTDSKIILAVNYPAKNELKLVELDENLSFSNEKSKEFKSSVQINSVLPLENDYLITANTIDYKHKSTTNQNELESKYLAFYFDNRFEESWKKEIGKNESFSYLEKVIPMRDGSYLLLGNSTNGSTAKGQDDFYLVKLGDKSSTEKRTYIEAYPNPTRDFVNVLINKEFEKAVIEVYNLTGQHLQTKEVKYRSTPILLSNYPAGVYILKINYDNQTESIKIIKK